VLKITEFGCPILRQSAEKCSLDEIKAQSMVSLVANMKNLLISKKLGVGLAAPQVGISKALFIIAIRSSELRPQSKTFDLVVINPEIVQTFGRRVQLYEGCISAGPGKAGLFAKVPRYKKLKLSYYDQQGKKHIQTFDGLRAHIIQHEVDHLNGVLFVDRVRDTHSYITYKEYIKLAQAAKAKKANKTQQKPRP
jgi:peptide deformylase